MCDYNRNRPRAQTKSNLASGALHALGQLRSSGLMGKTTHNILDNLPCGTLSSDHPAYGVRKRVARPREGSMITQVEIARRVGLDVSSVNKILNKRQGPVFRKETIRKVFKIARDLGYDFTRLKYAHRRRFPRKELSLGVELYVYHKDGSLYD